MFDKGKSKFHFTTKRQRRLRMRWKNIGENFETSCHCVQ